MHGGIEFIVIADAACLDGNRLRHRFTPRLLAFDDMRRWTARRVSSFGFMVCHKELISERRAMGYPLFGIFWLRVA